MAKYQVDLWEKTIGKTNYWVIRVGGIWLVVPEGGKYNKDDAQDAYLSIAGREFKPTPHISTTVNWDIKKEDLTPEKIAEQLKKYYSRDTTKLVKVGPSERKYYLFGENKIFLTENGTPIGTPTTGKAEQQGITGGVVPVPTTKWTTASTGGQEEQQQQGEEEKEVHGSIYVSVFTKGVKPGEVGIGGRYTFVYVHDGNTGKTTVLTFLPTDKIKVTNLGDGRVQVEGRGRDGKWTKFDVDAPTGNVKTLAGNPVGNVITTWEYVRGRELVAGGEVAGPGKGFKIENNETAILGYIAYTQKQKLPH